MTYASKKGAPPKASFNLGALEIDSHSKKKMVIVIKTSELNQFYFKCKNIGEKVEWLQAMKDGQAIAKHENQVVIGNNGLKDNMARAHSVRPEDDNKLSKKIEEVKEHPSASPSDISDYDVISPFKKQKSSKSDMTGEDPLNFLTENGVIRKDEVLETLSTIFYETKMLTNESPITQGLLGLEEYASKIQQKLEEASPTSPDISKTSPKKDNSQVLISDALGEVHKLRQCLQGLVNNFEDIRERLYPVAEKVALIELEKNPYKIPGEKYKRAEIEKPKVSSCHVIF